MACSPSNMKNNYLYLFVLGDEKPPNNESFHEQCSEDSVWPLRKESTGRMVHNISWDSITYILRLKLLG